MEDQLDIFDKNTSVTSRRLKQIVSIQTEPNPKDILFQHSVLCQTSLPYRNQKDARSWIKKQGNTTIMIQGLDYTNDEGNADYLGLPYGTKARLIMYYLNSMAVKTKSPTIAAGRSLNDSVKKLGLSTDGRSRHSVLDQLDRLSNTVFSMQFMNDMVKMGKQETLISEYAKSRNLQPSLFDDIEKKNGGEQFIVKLSSNYFQSLMEYAIPLDERAINALSNNSRALDLYTWLAYRLHKIDASEPLFITWKGIKEQFGDNVKRMCKFKEVFRECLTLVKLHYPAGKIEEDLNKGFILRQSSPPIKEKTSIAISA